MNSIIWILLLLCCCDHGDGCGCRPYRTPGQSACRGGRRTECDDDCPRCGDNRPGCDDNRSRCGDNRPGCDDNRSRCGDNRPGCDDNRSRCDDHHARHDDNPFSPFGRGGECRENDYPEFRGNKGPCGCEDSGE